MRGGLERRLRALVGVRPGQALPVQGRGLRLGRKREGPGVERPAGQDAEDHDRRHLVSTTAMDMGQGVFWSVPCAEVRALRVVHRVVRQAEDG